MEKDIESTIKSMLKHFKNEDHHKEVKDYLLVRKQIDKIKPYTIKNDVSSLLALSRYLGKKPFKNVTQNDMLKFEEYLLKEHQGLSTVRKNKKGLNQTTVELYEVRIKRFFKYLTNKKEYRKGKRFQKNIPYPESVSWVSSTNKNLNELPLDYILNDNEILKLFEVCDNARDQALIASLYDGGLRLSELISLNIKNLGFDELGGYFILSKDKRDLKTGARKIRLFLLPSSAQYLRQFLNTHPFRVFPNAPLFFTRKSTTYGTILDKVNEEMVNEDDFEKLRLSKQGLEGIVAHWIKVAKLPGGITPQTLRHNSATRCSKMGFNEMEMRIRFGWAPSSKMPSRYTHLSGADVDGKIKTILGIKEPEQKKPSILQPILCPNCEYENPPTNVVCGRCGMKLNIKKEDLVFTAANLGLLLQKAANSDDKVKNELDNLIRAALQRILYEDDLKTIKRGRKDSAKMKHDN